MGSDHLHYTPTREDEYGYGYPANGSTTMITYYAYEIEFNWNHPYEQFAINETIPVNEVNGISLTQLGNNPAYRYVPLDLGISYLERLKPYMEELLTNPPTT